MQDTPSLACWNRYELFPERARLMKWYGLGSLATLAIFVAWFAQSDLTLADAGLAVAAVYLCLGAMFPAVYVLPKWREKDESLELEACANPLAGRIVRFTRCPSTQTMRDDPSEPADY